jgi:hypothetical protein
MIEVAIEEMHGSDRVPDLNIDCERGIGWIRHTFNESEMALFFERVLLCAQKVLDTADIVRDGDLTPTIKQMNKL